jgi:predicted MPP superfamily phosphohydrolase
MFTIGIFADAQYWDGPANTASNRHYRESKSKLADCVSFFNGQELDFVLNMGDSIDRDFSSFGEIMPVANQLKAPLHSVLGNHDYEVDEVDLGKVPGALGLEQKFSFFDHKGWRFILLDGNDVSTYATARKSDEQNEAKELLRSLVKKKLVQAQSWNGAVGSGQLEWLESTLRDAREKDLRVMVVNHFPVYPVDAHNQWNDEAIIDVLEDSKCVAAYVNGHNHAGQYGFKNNIHYWTVKGMVQTQQENAYAVVYFHDDRIEITGYGREPSRQLSILV